MPSSCHLCDCQDDVSLDERRNGRPLAIAPRERLDWRRVLYRVAAVLIFNGNPRSVANGSVAAADAWVEQLDRLPATSLVMSDFFQPGLTDGFEGVRW